MNKNAIIIILVGLAIGLGLMFIGGPKNNNISQTNIKGKSFEEVNNTEIKDGIQYITINAKGGYSPRATNAQAGIPTKLIVKTNGTYDCSLSLSIKSVGFQKILQKTGEEVIDLGTPSVGAPIRGVCSMGMYSFEINFN